MTRSNIHIKLSNGNIIDCVADSSSAPEQAYIVETLIQPLLALNDAAKELAMLEEHCTMNEQRINATYRYIINLQTKAVHFFEENYDYQNDKFYTGADLTHRYFAYLETLRDMQTRIDQNNANHKN